MLKNADYIYNNIIIADEENTTKKYCKKAQVGVDLTARKIYKFKPHSHGIVFKDRTVVADYEELNTFKLEKLVVEDFPSNDSDNKEYYEVWGLEKGDYIVELNEGCSFGSQDTGYIIMRSSLNRSGVTVNSAVWDPGYTSKDNAGKIHSMSIRLTVQNEDGFCLEKNARIAQLLVFENEPTTNYNGQFQGGSLVSHLK